MKNLKFKRFLIRVYRYLKKIEKEVRKWKYSFINEKTLIKEAICLSVGERAIDKIVKGC